jgi:hypothetical protein
MSLADFLYKYNEFMTNRALKQWGSQVGSPVRVRVNPQMFLWLMSLMPKPSSMNMQSIGFDASFTVKKLCEFLMWERERGEVKWIFKTERGDGKGERGKEREGMGKGGGGTGRGG